MPLKLIEHLAGVGRLLDGSTVVADGVTYSIDVHQQFVEALPATEPLPGLKEISGSISGLDEGQRWRVQDTDLTLVLADGRRLDLRIDPGGRITPLSGLL